MYDAKATALPGQRLADLRPEIAAMAIKNLSRPNISPQLLAVRSNQKVLWRCQCGQAFANNVNNATKARVFVCLTCQRRGKSRLEFEIASLLRQMLAAEIVTHYGPPGDQVDLFVPSLNFAIEIDPYSSHSRKVEADCRRLAHHLSKGFRVLRVREHPLPGVPGSVKVPKKASAEMWAMTTAEGISPDHWQRLSPQQVVLALHEANAEWQSVLTTPPSPSLVDHPELNDEFVANLTHPGRTAEWLAAGSGDVCEWLCRSCGTSCKAPVGRRTGPQKSGCKPCSEEKRIADAATASPGESAADVAPDLLREFVRNLKRPTFDLFRSYPRSQDDCVWQCSICGKVWTAMIANRVNKSHTGCLSCNLRKSWTAERHANPDSAYALKWETHLRLLQQYVDREGHAVVRFDHYEDGFPLGGWVHVQRRHHASMQPARSKRLSEVQGWVWHKGEVAWEFGFRNAEAFLAREGHAAVPFRHFEGEYALGRWVITQRQRHTAGILLPAGLLT